MLDLATGSGLCAIAAMQAGAATVTGVDIDPFAEAAVDLEREGQRGPGAATSGATCSTTNRPTPRSSSRVTRRTRVPSPTRRPVAAAGGGAWHAVLVGDPGRRYLPTTDLVELAAFEVHTTTAFEDRDLVTARVFTLPGCG